MEVEAALAGAPMEEERELNNCVICQLMDSEGTTLEAPIFVRENAGPKELQQLVNKLLNNEEKLPYVFFVSDHELVVPLGSYLQKNKVSVEKAITIIFQPQTVFRIRPVTRYSSTIAVKGKEGHEDQKYYFTKTGAVFGCMYLMYLYNLF